MTAGQISPSGVRLTASGTSGKFRRHDAQQGMGRRIPSVQRRPGPRRLRRRRQDRHRDLAAVGRHLVRVQEFDGGTTSLQWGGGTRRTSTCRLPAISTATASRTLRSGVRLKASGTCIRARPAPCSACMGRRIPSIQRRARSRRFRWRRQNRHRRLASRRRILVRASQLGRHHAELQSGAQGDVP